MAARRQALRLAARALEQRLNADTSDHAGAELLCSCGEPAQYRGRHEKTFESVLGPLRLERAYYHCDRCQGGFCPRDRALRLELFSLTPGVLRMTGSAAALVSFEESSSLLHELAGVKVSVSQVQRAAEMLGEAIAIGACNEAAKCATYIIRNRRRMRYPKFHAQGLCTSTGILEAGCKVAIGTRLKRAGMHWSVPGANAVIALRCAKLSGRFEDFWERRSQQLAATA
jgi:hypothetical protein